MMIHNIKALTSIVRQECRVHRKSKYGKIYMQAHKHLTKAFDILEELEYKEQLDSLEREKRNESIDSLILKESEKAEQLIKEGKA